MRNLFDPSMAIGGAAISFFPNLNFGLKILLENNISQCDQSTIFFQKAHNNKVLKIEIFYTNLV